MTRGVRRKGTRLGEKGGAGSKDEPRQPPNHAGGVNCVSRLAGGGLGGQGG